MMRTGVGGGGGQSRAEQCRPPLPYNPPHPSATSPWRRALNFHMQQAQHQLLQLMMRRINSGAKPRKRKKQLAKYGTALSLSREHPEGKPRRRGGEEERRRRRRRGTSLGVMERRESVQR
uniref:Uncharacterized protein n=1 Tax=Knipowitschia caucasica TaxID=637954 RepID=A0AAV2JKG8_KNICA